MLHWEIVSGSKQHNAIRKMRNRFKTAPPLKKKTKKKTLSKEKQKTNNKVLVFFFFSLFFLREAARFFRPILFFLTSKQKKISRPPGTPADLSQRFTEFLPKPIENLSKTIFFCQDEPSLWKPNPAPGKNPALIVSVFSHLSFSLQQPPLLLLSQLKCWSSNRKD